MKMGGLKLEAIDKLQSPYKNRWFKSAEPISVSPYTFSRINREWKVQLCDQYLPSCVHGLKDKTHLEKAKPEFTMF